MRFWGWPELFGSARTLWANPHFLGRPALLGFPPRFLGRLDRAHRHCYTDHTGAVGIPFPTSPTDAIEPKTANKSAQNHTNSWLFWLAKPLLAAKIEP